mgnify:CR=1 FL=1
MLSQAGKTLLTKCKRLIPAITEPLECTRGAALIFDKARTLSRSPDVSHSEYYPIDLKTVPANDPYAALRYADFRFFISNSFLFSATIRVQEVIVCYELYKTTHDPLALGLVGLAEAIPFIITSLFGGYIADQKNKITIMHLSLVVILLGSVVLYTAFHPGIYNRLTQFQHLAVISHAGIGRVDYLAPNQAVFFGRHGVLYRFKMRIKYHIETIVVNRITLGIHVPDPLAVKEDSKRLGIVMVPVLFGHFLPVG